MTQSQLRPFRLLATDWLKKFAADTGIDFRQHGGGKQSITFGVPGESAVEARFIDNDPYIEFHTDVPALQPLIARHSAEAIENARRGRFGEVIWYSTEYAFPGLVPSFTRNMTSYLFEFLTAQTRVLGWRRIGPDVLLEFKEDQPEGGVQPSPFAPAGKVKVHLASRGPGPGFFSEHVAHQLAETAAAICAFSLGRPVAGGTFVIPTKSEETADLQAKHRDFAVLNIARKSVSLDIFSTVSGASELDHFHRMRAALRTHNAALAQNNDEVARILYVASMESLCSPRTPWKIERMSRRFLDFFDDLMPDALDEVVAHANFEEAFGTRRGRRTARALRRDMLRQTYALRSTPVHQGLAPQLFPFGLGHDESVSLQRGFFCDLSEKAILAYLRSPRSSLVGHPNLKDPPDCAQKSKINVARLD